MAVTFTSFVKAMLAGYLVLVVGLLFVVIPLAGLVIALAVAPFLAGRAGANKLPQSWAGFYGATAGALWGAILAGGLVGLLDTLSTSGIKLQSLELTLLLALAGLQVFLFWWGATSLYYSSKSTRTRKPVPKTLEEDLGVEELSELKRRHNLLAERAKAVRQQPPGKPGAIVNEFDSPLMPGPGPTGRAPQAMAAPQSLPPGRLPLPGTPGFSSQEASSAGEVRNRPTLPPAAQTQRGPKVKISTIFFRPNESAQAGTDKTRISQAEKTPASQSVTDTKPSTASAPVSSQQPQTPGPESRPAAGTEVRFGGLPRERPPLPERRPLPPALPETPREPGQEQQEPKPPWPTMPHAKRPPLRDRPARSADLPPRGPALPQRPRLPERPRKSGLAFGDEPKSKGPEDKGLDTVASSGLAGAASSIGGILGGIAKGAVEGFTMAAATIGEPPAKADGQPVTDKTMPEPKPAGEAAAAAPKPAQPRPKPPTRTPPASHSSMGTAVTGSAEDPIAAAVASVTHDAQKKKKD